MRREEARLMAQLVKALRLPPGAICLNVGSSTKEFRSRMQPHIESELIRPLEESGLHIVHCDVKPAEGVDEVGDLLDPAFRDRLKSYAADLLVCSNLLEHLTDPKDFAHACAELVVDGGYGLFSVPSSYPYHPDPIDTMLRPKPDELAAFLPGWTVIRGCELEVGTYWEDLRRNGRPVLRLARHVARVATPFYRARQWRENASRLLWLFRHYRVSIVLLEKPPAKRS